MLEMGKRGFLDPAGIARDVWPGDSFVRFQAVANGT
jgi:hypothetical protein